MNIEQDSLLKSIYWGQIYHDTIADSVWLKDRSVSPGRWAVGYEYLYVLYRALNDLKPKNILELGLGQSTKLTSQYAKHYDAAHIVVEHDSEWAKYFLRHFENAPQSLNINIKELVERQIENDKYSEHSDFKELVEGKKFNLISVDGPFGGSGNLSRRDILPFLPQILSGDFVILFDDCGRQGEVKTVQDAVKILQENGVEFVSGFYDGGGIKKTVVIASPSYKWVTSL